MTVSIMDPTTKFLITMAQAALFKQLELVKSHHTADHRVVDAISAAEAAISGAVNALLAL